MSFNCPNCNFPNKITDKYCQFCRGVLEKIIKRIPNGEVLLPLSRGKRTAFKVPVGGNPTPYNFETKFDPSLQSYLVRCDRTGVIRVEEEDDVNTSCLSEFTPNEWHSLLNGEILTFSEDQKVSLRFVISTGKAIPLEYSLDGNQNPESRYTFIKMLGGTPYRKIYQYYDKRVNRDVVLTFLNPEIADITEIRRFYRRHQTIPQIRHPNIPQLYNYGTWVKKNVQYYFTCREYIDGDSLENVQKGIDRRTMKNVFRIMLQIAESLRYIHEKGLLHRNLDPSNIIIGRDGCPYLIGFSLVKDPTVNMEVTMDGLKLARAGFASPELLRCKDVTAKSDIYSWAATFYWALSGFPPLGTEKLVAYYDKILEGERPRPLRWAISISTSPDPIDIYDKILSGKQKLLEGWEEVPKEIQDIIDRCLRYKIETRPPIDEVIQVLCNVIQKYDEDSNVELKNVRKPTELEFSGFKIAFLNCMSENISDFFDVFALNENQVGVLIGSANTRGNPTAKIAPMAKMSISLVAKLHHSTAETLRIVNKELLSQLPITNSYISAYYGILDKRTHTLRFSSAGHPPLLHYKPGSQEKNLYEPRGPVMGLYHDDFFSCDEVILSIQPNDILFLCTVGLTEGENSEGDAFGTEAIWQKLKERDNEGSMSDILEFVHKKFVEFTRREVPKRDITMIAIRVL